MFRVKIHCQSCRKAITTGDECGGCREARTVAHSLNISAKWRG